MLEIEISKIPDFRYLISEIQKPDRIIRAFAAYRKSKFYQNIAEGVDPYGKPYMPLTSAYLERKERIYGKKPIMVASREMIDGYDQKFDVMGFTESLPEPAGYHQEGISKMAKRTLLPDDRGLSVDDAEKLIELVFERLRG